MMNVDAVLFDLDDTLYGYGPCNEAGLEAAHAVLRGAVTVEREAFRAVHDAVRKELAGALAGQAAAHNRAIFFKHIVDRLARAGDVELALRMHEAYWANFYAAMRPAEGAHEVLGALAGRYRLGLVSNHVTLPQLGKIRQLGFQRYFSVIVTSEEAGVEKPAAAIFKLAMGRLNAATARAVMVGDSDTADIGGARAAGLMAVRTTQFIAQRADAPRADHVIAHLNELPSLLAVTPDPRAATASHSSNTSTSDFTAGS